MPFDGKKFREPLKTGLAGLAQLRDELRKPMPEGFEWNFAFAHRTTHCGTAGCAAGLSCVCWPDQVADPRDTFDGIDNLEEALALDPQVISGLFALDAYYPTAPSQVTPAMVADKIDEYLKANGFSG